MRVRSPACWSMCAATTVLLTSSVMAVTPQRAVVATQADWMEGTLEGLRVSASGELSLGPFVDLEANIEESIVWSVAAGSAGSVWAGTGSGGRLVRVTANGEVLVEASFEELQVTAIAGSGDAVYAATAPDGGVYAVRAGKGAELVARTPESYIWALVEGASGVLYAATGVDGMVYEIRGGVAKVFAELPDVHVVSLVMTADGSLLAGTSERGMVVRIDRDGAPRVLYDSMFREAKAIVVDAEGRIYAAINGGSSFRDSGAPPPPGEAVVTVSGDSPQGGTASRSQTLTLAPPEALGEQASEIVRLVAGQPAEVVARTRGEIVHALAITAAGEVLAATTKRLLAIGVLPQPDAIVIGPGGQVSALARDGASILVATTAPTRVYRVHDGVSRSGEYTSKVIAVESGDARWGAIETVGDTPEGTTARFETRSGGSREPDSTWTAWAATAGAQVASPPARFLQWRAHLASTRSITPRLRRVAVAYRPPNQRPEISAFVAHPPGVVFQRAASGTSLVDIVPPPLPSMFKELAPPRSDSATTGKRLYRRGAQTLTWEVADADGDDLYIVLSLTASDGDVALPLTDLPDGNAFAFDSEAVPDGWYVARLEVSDGPSNPEPTALVATRMSDPFLVDNTPPSLKVVSAEVRNRQGEVRLVAEDASSPLWRVEWSLDGAAFVPLDAEDGVTDGQRETIFVRTPELAKGDHLVVVRVYDLAGQSAAAGQSLSVR